MNKKIIILVAVLVTIIGASCGKKAPVPADGKFYYSQFANAKIAAEMTNKPMVIDFYTDW